MSSSSKITHESEFKEELLFTQELSKLPSIISPLAEYCITAPVELQVELEEEEEENEGESDNDEDEYESRESNIQDKRMSV